MKSRRAMKKRKDKNRVFKSFALLRKHCKSHFWILNFCTLAIGASVPINTYLLLFTISFIFNFKEIKGIRNLQFHQTATEKREIIFQICF